MTPLERDPLELARELLALERAGLRRRLPDPGAPRGIDFTSNDVLDLSDDPRLVDAATRALAEFGAGGRAARLLGGGAPPHARAEALCAEWLGSEAALLFPSGYQANLGMVGALCGGTDVVLSDALVHASLIDAARLAKAHVAVHRHGDLEHVEELLARHRGARRRWILTEGVFSMDGDRAPLAELAQLAERYDAWILLDEAHACGVLGPRGRGTWAELEGSAPARVAARVVTGGKAFGCTGAFVTGSGVLVDWLANRARSFVFTTAPSPAVAGMWLAAIPIVDGADEARSRVRSNAERLAAAFGGSAPDAAIVPVPIGEAEAAVAAAERIAEAGFDVRAVRPPTVPEGTSRLRCVVRAGHTDAEIRELGGLLADLSRPTRPGAARTPRRAPALVVAGTDTDVGKTVTSALVLRTALGRGPARYWKPLQTGDDSDTATVQRLTEAPEETFLEPLRHYPLPASPDQAAAAAGDSIPTEELTPAFESHRSDLGEGRLVVELAGGLLVPYNDRWTQLDWLESLGEDVAVVLAARSGLGTLNHTLLSLEALRGRGVTVVALVLVGPQHAGNRASLEPRLRGLPVVELPTLEPLDANALAGLADSLEGTPWL